MCTYIYKYPIRYTVMPGSAITRELNANIVCSLLCRMYDTVWLTRISTAFAFLAKFSLLSPLGFLTRLLNFIAHSLPHLVSDPPSFVYQAKQHRLTHSLTPSLRHVADSLEHVFQIAQTGCGYQPSTPTPTLTLDL